jgi:hypothetical protein
MHLIIIEAEMVTSNSNFFDSSLLYVLVLGYFTRTFALQLQWRYDTTAVQRSLTVQRED